MLLPSSRTRFACVLIPAAFAGILVLPDQAATACLRWYAAATTACEWLGRCHACALQVADGHHQHHVSELVCEELEDTLRAAVAEQAELEAALVRGGSLGVSWVCRCCLFVIV